MYITIFSLSMNLTILYNLELDFSISGWLAMHEVLLGNYVLRNILFYIYCKIHSSLRANWVGIKGFFWCKLFVLIL